MECHHIVQVKDGGDDSYDNCIPLCLNCHADVKAYNPDHPKGTSYSAFELKKHRDQWYNFCANNHVNRDSNKRRLIEESNHYKSQLREYRLKARNALIKFVDNCVKYPTIHNKKMLDRTQELVFEILQIKDTIEMLGPLSIVEFQQAYSSIITSAWQLQRLLDRQVGINPKAIDSQYESVEDNIYGIIGDLSRMRQNIKDIIDPYL
jgi:hypothetical protein